MPIIKIKIKNNIKNNLKNNIKNQINKLNSQKIMVLNKKKHMRLMMPLMLRRMMCNKSNKLMNQ